MNWDCIRPVVHSRIDDYLLVRSRSGEAMTTEDKPHVVYAADRPWREGASLICPTYEAAYSEWLVRHTYQYPWLIATLGRVIDPSTPVIDPNE